MDDSARQQHAGRSVPAMLLALVFVVWVGAAGVPTARSATVMSAAQLQALLEETNKAIQTLLATRKQSPPAALSGKRDRLGHTYTDDIQQNVMPPETQKRLEELSTSAAGDLRAGDLPGVQVKLVDLRRELSLEIERYNAIVGYWRDVAQSPVAGRPTRRETLSTLGIEPLPHSKEAAELEAQFDTQIAARDFVTAMRTTRPRLTEERKLADAETSQQIVSLLDSGGLQGLVAAAPTHKCVLAKETSKDSLPTVNLKAFPRSEDYYPLSLKRQGVSASGEVFVVVDRQGCPERSVIIGPSGFADADRSIARFAVDGPYLPAEKDGMAIRSGFSFRVSFSVGH